MLRLKELRKELGLTQTDMAKKLSITQPSYSLWENGKTIIDIDSLVKLSDILGASSDYILGKSSERYISAEKRQFSVPDVTDDFVSFPVLGEIAAGYDTIAVEDWDGDKIDIPKSYLKGWDISDFIVLCVKGDSMYPQYQNGDKVLVLKCSALDYSGQVGAILYDDKYVSLKKIEFKQGENWLNLVSINPSFPTKTIKDEELEHCRIIGKPRWLIREI